MRTVTGSTDHVVVVGAGLAGLATALHLAGRGRAVTVVEREPVPGGRAGRLDIGGYRLDTGPSVLTMPGIVADTLAAVGEDLEARLDLQPVVPAYRACFADGSALDVHSDRDAMEHSIAEFAGPGEVAGYRKLRDWLSELYHVEFDRFVAANFDSPLSLVTPALGRLIALGGFRRLDRAIGGFLTDARLRRVFTFQSLYAGVSPQRALALYAVIAYMDTIGGVYFPRGGMRALPTALAAAATDAGVQFHYSEAVTDLERRGTRISAVHTDKQQRITCDAVVLATELHTAYHLLHRSPRRPVRVRPAPSAVVAHIGVPTGAPTAHHTLLFGDAWEQTFDELIGQGVPMSDPSLLVTRPTATDSTLAPPGHDLFSVLAPVPNLDRGAHLEWERRAPAYGADLAEVVERRLLPGFAADAEIVHLDSPEDWARRGMLAGTPFSLAHTFSQTGPFRPANLPRGVPNAVLAGCGTVPGVGVPTALLSGRLAADRITGAPAGRDHGAPIADISEVRP
ncbi:phytoene desaturase [Nocardia cyriacigeorgica]|uniref:phytoene desaturase family protein n=1 Tax=Nocardia cyriacigeorgica TaxID=135487 RepID=UPI00189548FA|nr:phytoene desaturase family protein [Nocardia cyriacigeorgica]MBF6097666.1 phytoene desaturase [Nocardia cyriacigeorgica]MBF6161690.1 phytoene desaturase [Nocardia cyriacigeorgica]MBF6200488.1 phytoene desaturase [Nocardia cyriacigeorgica]MBF6342047.1 phytoene desaturase [Nocardia cyriacigeorgica]MBF6512989.1 phytoene desaturase [Nocardia cyriacigeorgica]